MAWGNLPIAPANAIAGTESPVLSRLRFVCEPWTRRKNIRGVHDTDIFRKFGPRMF